MFLILANAGDLVALQVANKLALWQGREKVIFLSAEYLAQETVWRYRQTSHDERTEIRLPEGRVIDCRDLSAVFNRLWQITPPHFIAATEADRLYATSEMFAFLLSWLSGLQCPVINPANPRALSGAPRNLTEWMKMAASAGLATRPLRLTSKVQSQSEPPETDEITRRVLIVGGEITGESVDQWAGASTKNLIEGCRRLAQHSQADLIEAVFAQDGSAQWRLNWATTFPASLSDPETESVASWMEARAATNVQQHLHQLSFTRGD